MGFCSCYCVADLSIVVDRRLCVVLIWIKARAGRVGAYLKAIVTCVINFVTNVDVEGDGGWASIVAASQTLLLSSLDDFV